MQDKLESLYFSLFGVKQQQTFCEAGIRRAKHYSEGNMELFLTERLDQLNSEETNLRRDIELTIKNIK